MSAVDDAKKYLSLRPPIKNKTIFALHPDVLVGGLLDEIERLRLLVHYAFCEGQITPFLLEDWINSRSYAALKEGK